MAWKREGDDYVIVVKPDHLRVLATVIAGIAVGLVVFFSVGALRRGSEVRPARDATTDSAAWAEAPRFDITIDGRPYLGTVNAPVTIVEFTDYGCPVCRRHASEVLPQLLERYGDSIRYVVRHFPIPALTANAMTAAIAAECAHQQDRYWAFRDSLLSDTVSISTERLRSRAAAAGLDTASFVRCLAGDSTRTTVERDILDGWNYGVTGTPTFFINGRRFRGARTLEEFVSYVTLAGRGPGE